MITIKSEAFISEKGKREINEDSLQFQSGKFYIVCDGLGGNGNGQIASELVTETVKESLLKSKSILEAVQEAEKVLSSYKKKHPSTEHMATTIAFAQIIENNVLIFGPETVEYINLETIKLYIKPTTTLWLMKL